VGQQVGNDAQLGWELPETQNDDITHYNVYRNESSGVTPTPENLIGSVPDLTFLDTTTGGLLHFYVITAVDLSENESAPSNEVSVAGATGIGDQASIPPRALTVLPASPNPFSEATFVRFGLPRGGDVTIDVYDVSGRRLVREQITNASAGWNTYALRADVLGRGDLSSGVYVVKVTAAGTTQAVKLILAR
jgi:hypothetical protein